MRDVQRQLQADETEFSVTGESGEEYLVEFSGESDKEVIVVTESEAVPDETTVTVADGSITTVVVGTKTYQVSYDDNGEIDDVDEVPGSSPSRRTQQGDVADRRLQSCEEGCTASANQLCGGLRFGCGYPPLAEILGVICDDLGSLCNTFGIVEGCDRKCALREYSRLDPDVRKVSCCLWTRAYVRTEYTHP